MTFFDIRPSGVRCRAQRSIASAIVLWLAMVAGCSEGLPPSISPADLDRVERTLDTELWSHGTRLRWESGGELALDWGAEEPVQSTEHAELAERLANRILAKLAVAPAPLPTDLHVVAIRFYATRQLGPFSWITQDTTYAFPATEQRRQRGTSPLHLDRVAPLSTVLPN